MATTSQVVTSQLPAAFETFYTSGAEGQKGLIPQAFQLFGQGTPQAYQSIYMDPLKAAGMYTGAQRVAPLSGAQQQLGQQIQQLGTPSQFTMGTGALGSAYGTIGGGLPSLLDQGLLQRYMSPYAQGVVDVQKQKAIEDAQKTQLGANLGAARQGTYGGARQMLAQTERERALGTQLGDIQARGLQAAFEAGQRGLEAERTAQLQRAQTLGTIGQQFGQLGVAQQAADIDRLKTLGAYGDLERAVAQQQRDIDYENIMRQIQFPETQLGKLSEFIRGIPTDQRTTTTTPPPSFASQLAGLGLSGLGIYQMLNPKG
jgi:hypothetical protein